MAKDEKKRVPLGALNHMIKTVETRLEKARSRFERLTATLEHLNEVRAEQIELAEAELADAKKGAGK